MARARVRAELGAAFFQVGVHVRDYATGNRGLR